MSLAFFTAAAVACGARTELAVDLMPVVLDAAVRESGGATDAFVDPPRDVEAFDASLDSRAPDATIAADAPADVAVDVFVDALPDDPCGTVTLDPPTVIPIGCFPTTLAIGDVTGDGMRDLVVTDGVLFVGEALSVLRNVGGRMFARPASYPAGPEVNGLAITDIDGDGLSDVVTTNHESSAVGVFVNGGGGVFRPQVPYPAGGGPDGGPNWASSVAAGDFDGDGLPDIAVAEQDLETQTGGAIGVFLSRGGGLLKAQVAYPNTAIAGAMGGTSARGPSSIAVADLDGDGWLDMVIATIDERVAVYLNNGDGTFAPEVTYPIGAEGPSGDVNCLVAVGDIDGDARPDLVVTNELGPTIGVLLNIGGGAFAPERTVFADPSPTLDFSYTFMAVIDIDGDGRNDIVTASANGGMPGVSTFSNLGGVTFAPPLTYADDSSDFVTAMAVGDLDGDGLADVAVAAANTCQIEVFFARCH